MRTLDECRAAFGNDVATKTVHLGGELVTFVCRKARGREMRNFLAATQMGGGKGPEMFAAMEEIAKSCCVSHTPQELDDVLDVHPMIFEVLGAMVLDASKEALEAVGKGFNTAGKKR